MLLAAIGLGSQARCGFSERYRRLAIKALRTLVFLEGHEGEFCPLSGKIVALSTRTTRWWAMPEPVELTELVAYLVRTTRLTLPEAVHLVDEMLSFLNERPDEFVCRRHRELQAEGVANA